METTRNLNLNVEAMKYHVTAAWLFRGEGQFAPGPQLKGTPKFAKEGPQKV